jgi:tetratricopeptide (TPR) repeat protein
MRRWSVLVYVLLALLAPLPAAATEDAHDCDKLESERRIRACTELIESPTVTDARRALAYANRALSYSLRGQYETAIKDYDQAIRMFPDFAVALNNRAWAYFKWGRAAEGMPDVQRSLQLEPLSPHSLDTRAHIYQTLGETQRAMRDYEMAMVYGGERMVTLYQCGLKMHKLYSGPNDGIIRAELLVAMRKCVEQGAACDPLPPDEDCRDATS